MYVIDGKNDAKITQIPVGKNPSFILIPEYNPGNRIYVANEDSCP